MSRVTVTVVIPALNEELNLRHVLPSIPRDVHEVILVDGSSTDRTVEVARELIPNIRVIQQEGTGKGAAAVKRPVSKADRSSKPIIETLLFSIIASTRYIEYTRDM